MELNCETPPTSGFEPWFIRRDIKVNAIGYSCQVLLALYINKKYYKDKHYVWFSQAFNPIMNGDSSNPLLLYLWLDRAVKWGDVNHPKIKDLKAGLQSGVDAKYHAGEITDDEAAKLKADIASADISWFRPQILKINVDKIDEQQITTNGALFPDEYLVEELHRDEFEIIVE